MPSETQSFLPEGIDFIEAVERLLIAKYELDKTSHFAIYMYHENLDDPFEEFGLTSSEPEYLVRLLPLLYEKCLDNDENLSPDKFEDVFVILSAISLFYQEDDLQDANDTKFIYVKMCTAFCEWLTNNKGVMVYFGQQFNVEHYVMPSGVTSQHITFNKENYLQSIWSASRELTYELLNKTWESKEQAEAYDFDHLDRLAPWEETRFSESIVEWFNIASVSDPEKYFLSEESYGIFSRGFKRYEEWNPRYRLMIYSALIRQIFSFHSQTCLMFNEDLKIKLSILNRKGQLCLKEDGIMEEFDNFWIEQILWDFQLLSQVSSLFLLSKASDVFHHCSSTERMYNGNLSWFFSDNFEHSLACKWAVVMSSIDHVAQERFDAIMGGLGENITQYDEQFNENAQLKRLAKESLQSFGYTLKNEIEDIIKRITPNSGASAIKRINGFEKAKKEYISLFKTMGISTNIPSGKKGRRVEVLFYHQNKNRSSLTAEIQHLPNSLNDLMKLFNDTNCVLTAPYLVILTLAHVLRFTQCIYSLGGLSNERLIGGFGGEINYVVGVLDKWEFLESSACLGLMRDLFRDEDEYGNPIDLTEISRQKVIEIQNELKEIYDEWLKVPLHFSKVVPRKLNPYFS